jgi:4-carboxymuconolactone decarboxylase
LEEQGRTGSAGRTPPLRREDLPPAARAHWDAIAGDRGEVPWLFRFLLASPDLAARVSHTGDFLRAHTSIPEDLHELLILALARRLDFQLEWSYHEGMARDAGVSESLIAALRAGRTPELPADWAAAHELALAAAERRVSDAQFDAVVARFGAAFAVEVVVLVAFVVFMQWLVEALDVPLPEGVPALLPIPAGAAAP